MPEPDTCDYTCDECGDFGAHPFIMIHYHAGDETGVETEVSFCSAECTSQWLTLRDLEARL